MLFNALNGKSNVPQKCPIKSLSFRAEHITINSDLLPPFLTMFFPEGKLKFRLFIEIFGTPKPKAKYVKFATTKFLGIVYNSDVFKNVSLV